jgi:predicted Zn-dependent protease with MMP-like domain
VAPAPLILSEAKDLAGKRGLHAARVARSLRTGGGRRLDGLPEEIAGLIENVAVVVEEEPSDDEIRDAGLDPEEETLFGIYQGVALPERGAGSYGSVLPDRIVIYRQPLLEACSSRRELLREIRDTVVRSAIASGLGEGRLPWRCVLAGVGAAGPLASLHQPKRRQPTRSQRQRGCACALGRRLLGARAQAGSFSDLLRRIVMRTSRDSLTGPRRRRAAGGRRHRTSADRDPEIHQRAGCQMGAPLTVGTTGLPSW